MMMAVKGPMMARSRRWLMGTPLRQLSQLDSFVNTVPHSYILTLTDYWRGRRCASTLRGLFLCCSRSPSVWPVFHCCLAQRLGLVADIVELGRFAGRQEARRRACSGSRLNKSARVSSASESLCSRRRENEKADTIHARVASTGSFRTQTFNRNLASVGAQVQLLFHQKGPTS